MAVVIIKDEYLTDIADAIRSKNGLTDTYKPSEMASAISDIQGGVFTSNRLVALNVGSGSFAKIVRFDLTSYKNKQKIVFVDCLADITNSTNYATASQLFAFHIDANDIITKIEAVGYGTLAGLLNIYDEIIASVSDGILTITMPDEDELKRFHNIQALGQAPIYYVE